MFILGNNTPQWVIHSGFSSFVDFCIWVLETDGLKVPLFDLHKQGNRKLQDKGMNAESWSNWFLRVVLLEDQRLNWYRTALPPRVDNYFDYEQIAAIAQTVDPNLPLEMLDTDSFAAQDAQYRNWEQLHYQQAVTAARQIFGEVEVPPRATTPAELWQGEIAARDLLREMWTFYYSKVFSSREQQLANNDPEYFSSSLFDRVYKRVNPPAKEIAALELYFVAYSAPVEQLIPPASVILSIPKRTRNQPLLVDRIVDTAERLIKLTD